MTENGNVQLGSGPGAVTIPRAGFMDANGLPDGGNQRAVVVKRVTQKLPTKVLGTSGGFGVNGSVNPVVLDSFNIGNDTILSPVLGTAETETVLTDYLLVHELGHKVNLTHSTKQVTHVGTIGGFFNDNHYSLTTAPLQGRGVYWSPGMSLNDPAPNDFYPLAVLEFPAGLDHDIAGTAVVDPGGVAIHGAVHPARLIATTPVTGLTGTPDLTLHIHNGELMDVVHEHGQLQRRLLPGKEKNISVRQ